MGVDARHVDVAAESQRHRVAGGMVPAGVGRQPPGLGNHVAVEEGEDVARGGAGAVVACPGQAEAQVLLMDHLHTQRRRCSQLQRRVRPVVHHDHLEQLHRVRLALQPGQGQGERVVCLVEGDYHRREPGRIEVFGRRDGQRAPVVASHCGRGRRAAHSTVIAPSSAMSAWPLGIGARAAGLRAAAISNTQL